MGTTVATAANIFRTVPPMRLRPTLATGGPGGKPLDLNKIEFKIQLEVKGIDPDRFNRQIRDLKWTAQGCPPDCSHGHDGGYGTYQRVSSPHLTLGGGGLEQLGEMLNRLQQAGARPGSTGAFRIHVRDNVLDDQGVTNLVNMHLNNEHILYRLGQAGGVGRAIADKERWSPPLSRGSAYTGGGLSNVSGRQSVQQWKNTLSNYHWGMNAGTKGYWEFRYFDSTMDAAAAAANVKLLLGMVKAASENRGQWNQVNAVSSCYNKQVDRKQWNAFINEVAEPDVKRQLEANFRASSGQLEKEMLSGPARKALGRLIGSNYRFEDAQRPGQALSVDHVAQLLDGNRPLQVTLPQQQRLTLQADQVEAFAHGESGDTGQLPKELQDQSKAAAALMEKGVNFTQADGTMLSPFQTALVSAEDGRVVAQRGAEAVPLGKNGLSLQEILSIENGDTHGLSPAARATVGALPFLKENGYAIKSADGSTPIWAPHIAQVCKSGQLVVSKDGKDTPVGSWQALETDVIYPEKKARLGAADQQLLDKVGEASDKGFVFSRPGQDPPQKGTVPFFMTVMGDTELQVQIPGAAAPTPIPNRDLLKTFVLVELKQDDQLDDNTRKILEVEDALRQKDYKFFNKRTEDEIKSRSGVSLTLSTEDQRLTMRAPGAKRRTRLTQKAMENVLHLENGRPDQMDAALRTAVERGNELRAMGFNLQMKDIVKEGNWVDANPAEMLATLEGGRRIGLVDPTGNRTVAAGTDAFVQAADAKLQVTRAITPEQANTLQTFQQLLGQRQIVTQTTINGAPKEVAQAAMLPWLFNEGQSVRISTPQEHQMAGGVGMQINGWADLQQFVATETLPPQPGAPHADVLRHTADLRTKGVRFFYVQSPRRAPVDIGLNSALVQHLDQDGVRVQLPRWSLWKGFPRKRITIHGEADMNRLARKFAD